MHKAICTELEGQTCVWQNTIMLIKLFGFSTLYVFLDFWHKASKDWSERTNIQRFKKIVKTSWNVKHKQTTKQSLNILKELMHRHVLMLMHEYPSSPIRHVCLGWYPYRIGYLSCDSQTLGWSFPNNKWWRLSSSSHHQYQD